jgi:hypothetical protein
MRCCGCTHLHINTYTAADGHLLVEFRCLNRRNMATQLISKLPTMSKIRGYVPASSAAALAQVTGREVRVYCLPGMLPPRHACTPSALVFMHL